MMKKPFENEEEFQRIYGICDENSPGATEEIIKHREMMEGAFDNYISAIEENAFRYAYECGWNAAMKGGEL